jgi:hypothetical protein
VTRLSWPSTPMSYRLSGRSRRSRPWDLRGSQAGILILAATGPATTPNTIHRWQVRLPDNGGPVYTLPPRSRAPPSGRDGLRVHHADEPVTARPACQLGVQGVNTHSRCSRSAVAVEITEWAEREPALTPAPSVFRFGRGRHQWERLARDREPRACLTTHELRTRASSPDADGRAQWRQAGDIPEHHHVLNVNLSATRRPTRRRAPRSPPTAPRVTLVYSGGQVKGARNAEHIHGPGQLQAFI